MSGFEETRGPTRKDLTLSEDELSTLSLIEIEQHIAFLQSEIERLKAVRNSKGNSRAAAEALFR